MNGLEETWGDQVAVLQININNRENRALAEDLDALFTPTFILFNQEGQESWRSVGSIDADEVSGQVEMMAEAFDLTIDKIAFNWRQG